MYEVTLFRSFEDDLALAKERYPFLDLPPEDLVRVYIQHTIGNTVLSLKVFHQAKKNPAAVFDFSPEEDLKKRTGYVDPNSMLTGLTGVCTGQPLQNDSSETGVQTVVCNMCGNKFLKGKVVCSNTRDMEERAIEGDPLCYGALEHRGGGEINMDTIRELAKRYKQRNAL